MQILYKLLSLFEETEFIPVDIPKIPSTDPIMPFVNFLKEWYPKTGLKKLLYGSYNDANFNVLVVESEHDIPINNDESIMTECAQELHKIIKQQTWLSSQNYAAELIKNKEGLSPKIHIDRMKITIN